MKHRGNIRIVRIIKRRGVVGYGASKRGSKFNDETRMLCNTNAKKKILMMNE